MKTNAIILAAGKGTRMKTELPKVMHTLQGIPMVEHLVNKLEEMSFDEIIVVVGYKAEIIKEHLGDRVKYVVQEKQLGTGHAVQEVSSVLQGKEGTTLVLAGDTPLLSKETINNLINFHQQHADTHKGTVLTAVMDNPTGYGRILNDKNLSVLGIVEEKDASNEQKKIKEVNSGIMCFDNQSLFELIGELENKNKQSEYYLTDMVEIFNNKGLGFNSFSTKNPEEVIGINDRDALARTEEILNNIPSE